jgi:hypothetical protein
MSRKFRAKPPSPFLRFNSSPEVIRLVVMMYIRFPLSLRNVEELLFERGIDICHETVRMWWNRFGPMFAGDVRRQRVSRTRGFRHWRWPPQAITTAGYAATTSFHSNARIAPSTVGSNSQSVATRAGELARLISKVRTKTADPAKFAGQACSWRTSHSRTGSRTIAWRWTRWSCSRRTECPEALAKSGQAQ